MKKSFQALIHCLRLWAPSQYHRNPCISSRSPNQRNMWCYPLLGKGKLPFLVPSYLPYAHLTLMSVPRVSCYLLNLQQRKQAQSSSMPATRLYSWPGVSLRNACISLMPEPTILSWCHHGWEWGPGGELWSSVTIAKWNKSPEVKERIPLLHKS